MSDPTPTYVCQEPGCSTPVSQPVGRWSRCTTHRLARESVAPPSRVVPIAAGFESKARELVGVGRKVDRALAKFRPAKRDAEAALAEWKSTLRRLAGEESAA